MDKETGMIYAGNDLGMRLSKTLIRFKGQPFYVDNIGHDRKYLLNGMFTMTGKVASIELPCKDIDLRPVPLGYANFNGTAVYLSRIPVRRYKQGLSHENISVNGPLLQGKRDILTTREVAACVNGAYPKLDAAMRAIDNGAGSVAFHRQWAVHSYLPGRYKLQYRGRTVGELRDAEMQLNEGSEYLKELLQTVLEAL
jgi:hypothetical protein